MTWPAAAVAVGEGMTAVGSSVWLLGLFQRRFDHTGKLARALGRAAFGAYVLQAPVAVAIARLAHPLAIAPELKFLVVAPATVAASFGLLAARPCPRAQALPLSVGAVRTVRR